MSLAEEARQQATPRGPKCHTCRLLAKVTPAERAEIEEALANEDLEGEAIARALQARGHDIQGPPLQRHRRGGCVPR